MSSNHFRFKKIIYDRVDDADVKVTSTSAIAQMYIRKQNIFTEKKIFPYAKMEDLRLVLLPKNRVMAQNHAGGQHQSVIFCGQFNTCLSVSLPAPAFALV